MFMHLIPPPHFDALQLKTSNRGEPAPATSGDLKKKVMLAIGAQERAKNAGGGSAKVRKE